MVNKIIVTALNDEANPIIKFYNLSRDTRHSDLKVYINDNINWKYMFIKRYYFLSICDKEC